MTLTDTADLEGGVNPTGTIKFELFQGGTLVHMETVTVHGNGSYTTPMGFTLPGSGTATGTYQWDAAYSGDAKHGSISDNNAADEQVTVSAASPTLTTAPSPDTVTLGTTSVRLKDTADLENGCSRPATITFELLPGQHADGHRDGVGQRQRHLHDAHRLHAAEDRHGDRHLLSGTPPTVATPTTAQHQRQQQRPTTSR